MRKTELIVLGIVILSFLIGIYFYNQFPDKVASHWNAQGQVDGYMSKFWGLFLMPFISVGLFLLFIIIPKIDPLKQNIQKFRKYFDNFIILIFIFLLYLFILTIIWNLGIIFDMILVLMPAFALLLYYSGVLIQNARRNWFIGIRTPWTLSSDEVWNKTHKIGARLFKICGIITLLGFIFQNIAIWLLFVPIILSTIYIYVYSFFEYRKTVKKEEIKNARKEKREG